MDFGLSNWIVLLMSVAVALIGLIFATSGEEFVMNFAGWVFIVFGLWYAIRLGGRIAAAPDRE